MYWRMHRLIRKMTTLDIYVILVVLIICVSICEGQPTVTASVDYECQENGQDMVLTCTVTNGVGIAVLWYGPPGATTTYANNCRVLSAGETYMNMTKCDDDGSTKEYGLQVYGVNSPRDGGDWKCEHGVPSNILSIDVIDPVSTENNTQLPLPANVADADDLLKLSNTDDFSHTFNCSFNKNFDMKFIWKLGDATVAPENIGTYSTFDLNRDVVGSANIRKELICEANITCRPDLPIYRRTIPVKKIVEVGGLSTGAKVGIGIGAVAFTGCCGCAVFGAYKWRSNKRQKKDEETQNELDQKETTEQK